VEEPLRDPGIADGESTTYRAVIKGQQVATGTLIIDASDGGSPSYVERFDVGFDQQARYKLRITFAREDGFVYAEHYRLETYYRERPVAREEGWFRDVKGLQFGGSLEPYPRSLTPLLGGAVLLRGLDFRPGASRRIPVWLANSIYWEIAAKVEKSELIEIPAGECDAWRVRVRPSFAAVNKQLDRVIGLFLPPFIAHFEREPSHRLLRFEFPTGPFPWNPRATVEALDAA
jgi:hypothetical protein